MRFAREALPFVIPPLLLAGVLGVAARPLGAAVSATVAVALLLFFRIPRLRGEAPAGSVLAAAFGRVTRVDEIHDPALGPERFQRIVTFLSVFDVHVQRCPVSGRVTRRDLAHGRRVAAFRDDADQVNESELSVLEDGSGHTFAVRQVVGLIARRIVCYLEEGQSVARGESLGLIRFGSRVDLLVPSSFRILVKPGDRLRAGETVVAGPPGGEGG